MKMKFPNFFSFYVKNPESLDEIQKCKGGIR